MRARSNTESGRGQRARQTLVLMKRAVIEHRMVQPSCDPGSVMMINKKFRGRLV